MSAISKIQWTDRTWNPVRGCSIVSSGCVNCYAMKQAHRFSGSGRAYEGLTKQTKAGPQWTGKIRTVESALLEPLSWRKPQRVFVNSMSDLFHDGVPDEFIERVFSVMALAERHTFQILTKRPSRMLAWFRARRFDVKDYAILHTEQAGDGHYAHPWPLPNVWLGVSCEDQRRADERIPLLLQTPAAIRFISAEPLLDAIDLRDIQPMRGKTETAEGLRPLIHFAQFNALNGEIVRDRMGFDGPALDWVIVGGESGANHRPTDIAWFRRILRQCETAGVPVFVKQLGAQAHDGVPIIITKDRKGGDPSEWSADLRVRQFPATEIRA